MRTRHREHPFLVVDSRYNIVHRDTLAPEICNILYTPVKMSKHHLYPRDRTRRQGPYSSITLKLWCYKHFYGWNSLFQFFYTEDGERFHTELTIDEIITCMIERHPFIMTKVGTRPWRVLFGSKGIEEAIDLLCRMLALKFNREPIYIMHAKVHEAIPKKFAA